MSDGMTDRRGQSERVLTTAELDKFKVDLNDKFLKYMIESELFQNTNVSKVKVLARELAFAAQMVARNVER